ncbi:hypothetical protein N0V90_006208 [Kalmusia sp. IMI 367209]|nr:hypothetical protein N0V90_006208 [Kalmusia sp. IMI 367209]
MPPLENYLSNEDIVKRSLPRFGYQIHLASGEVEESVNNEQSIRQFLKAIYGARTPSGEFAFDPYKGVIVENLPTIGESKLLNGKILDYYVKDILDKKTISIPTLFIQATDDNVLTPEMSKGMERYIPRLTRAEVKASHWALTQTPHEVNAIIAKWLDQQGLGIRSSL